MGHHRPRPPPAARQAPGQRRWRLHQCSGVQPRRHTLASSPADGTVRLWDIIYLAHPRPLGKPLATSNSGVVDAVAFSPDGRKLASGNAGTIWLWDVTDPAHPQPLGQPLATSNGGGFVSALAFSRHARTLASSSIDGITQLWSLNTQDAIDRICAAVGPLAPPQWHHYIRQLPYQLLC